MGFPERVLQPNKKINSKAATGNKRDIFLIMLKDRAIKLGDMRYNDVKQLRKNVLLQNFYIENKKTSQRFFHCEVLITKK